jgi:transcriptional regulator with XRE-family HTH domain
MKNRIKEVRKKADVKQRDLAKSLCVSQGTLSNWERGEHDPGSENLMKIALIFDVSVDYLLYKTNVPNREYAPNVRYSIARDNGDVDNVDTDNVDDIYSAALTELQLLPQKELEVVLDLLNANKQKRASMDVLKDILSEGSLEAILALSDAHEQRMSAYRHRRTKKRTG